ncbi:MAG: hypothetical protein QOF77_596 [Solirubrobacteraceae bacterium]|nr:hypothetical protein [Solirubrobacteraceae bacterium]
MPNPEILLLAGLAVTGVGLPALRLRARAGRSYVRLVVEPYRGDRARPEAILATVAALHAVVAGRGPRRFLCGQPSLALEVHLTVRSGGAPLAWLAVCMPVGLERQAQAALRSSYPNCALRPVEATVGPGGAMIRLHKRLAFTEPVRRLADVDPERPPVERLLRAMGAAGGPSVVQLALTPAPALLGRVGSTGRSGETSAEGESQPVLLAPGGRSIPSPGGRSILLAPGGRSVGLAPGGPYFYADIRVIGRERAQVSAIAAELRAGTGPNRLVGRPVAPGGRRAYRRRVARGEGNPLPSPLRRAYGAEEIAALWQVPSVGFTALPCRRRPIPLAPAPAGIMRVAGAGGLLRDEHGPVTIHPQLRRQNTAVVGTVEQGKTSYLVASVREDLRREDCAVIVLDPKGDAAEAALSVVPDSRVCTLLDLARPTCGFNPLAVAAPIDAIADYVVAALRQLFAEGEVRGSSDRYLRNAVIAVLAFDRRASLWDAARLLEVGPAGVAFRAEVAHRLAAMPEVAEVAAFLAEELPGQLADARASTTAKLDAPANKLARVLNSASVKRVLLNDSVTVDFDRLIERREVLIVRGALGEIGPGNVSVLMQLLVGMLDAALARAQDRRAASPATAVALKVDEAPLVINAAFAQTLALKRSAGLETVACWQTDAQWEPDLREQLDALFAHRVLFATASAVDARAAAGLLMAEFSDQVRSGDQAAASLAAPDVRLHLPRHTAIVSWSTPSGRERPFIARTLPLEVDTDRIERVAARQRARGGREVDRMAPPPRLGDLGPPAGSEGGRDVGPPPPSPGVDPPWRPGERESGPGGSGSGARESQAGPREPESGPGESRSGPGERQSGAGGWQSDHGDPQSGPCGPQSGPRESPSSERRRPSSTRREPAGLSRRPGSHETGILGEPASTRREAWSSGPVELAPAARRPEPSVAPCLEEAAETPTPVPATYAELLALDAADRVRWLPVRAPVRRPVLDAAELELLGWIAAGRCVLSSQAHRRLCPGRALTTTQRRLKRLADAGLLARFQLHGGDGGGVPFACAATDAALDLLEVSGRRAPVLGEETLDSLRRDIHVVGWLLALEARAGGALVSVLGPGRARITPGREAAIGPGGLDLGVGFHARDFLTGDPGGARRSVERFLPVTPAAVVELRRTGARPVDVLVFAAPAAAPSQTVALIERCDHLIAGWWRRVPRYARLGSPPAAVILCPDRDGAQALAGIADRTLVACLARIGEPPERWERPGREGLAFVAESDLHHGRFVGWQVAALPGGTPRFGPIVDLDDVAPRADLPPWH